MADKTREQALKALQAIAPKLTIAPVSGGQFLSIREQGRPPLLIQIPPGITNRRSTGSLR
jgi:hypothetical protein